MMERRFFELSGRLEIFVGNRNLSQYNHEENIFPALSEILILTNFC